MFDKFFKEGKSKDIIIKLITIAVIAAVLLVAFDVLTQTLTAWALLML